MGAGAGGGRALDHGAARVPLLHTQEAMPGGELVIGRAWRAGGLTDTETRAEKMAGLCLPFLALNGLDHGKAKCLALALARTRGPAGQV